MTSIRIGINCNVAVRNAHNFQVVAGTGGERTEAGVTPVLLQIEHSIAGPPVNTQSI